MALIDKLKAIADGFRASRGTTREYSLDEMAVLAAEKVGVDSETITGFRLNYIQSTGTQYFDTGVVADATTEIEMQYSVQTILIYGGHLLSSKQFFTPLPRLSYNTNNEFCFFAARFGNEMEVEYMPLVDTIYTVKAFPSNAVVINGTTSAFLEQGSNEAAGTLYMNTYGGDPGNDRHTPPATIYYCKIWKNGVLVRDFVPFESLTGVVGMLDLVENKVYTSAGTGQFVAGDRVANHQS